MVQRIYCQSKDWISRPGSGRGRGRAGEGWALENGDIIQTAREYMVIYNGYPHIPKTELGNIPNAELLIDTLLL
jgi:hypothetical protein